MSPWAGHAQHPTLTDIMTVAQSSWLCSRGLIPLGWTLAGLAGPGCPGQGRAGQGQPGQNHRGVQVSVPTRARAPGAQGDSGPASLGLLQLNCPEMALHPL